MRCRDFCTIRSGFKKSYEGYLKLISGSDGERRLKNGFGMYRNENQSGIWKRSEEILGCEIIRFPRDGSEVPGIDGFESATVALFDIQCYHGVKKAGRPLPTKDASE